MKLWQHHAAALALVGWYLMLPPEPILSNPANRGKSDEDLVKESTILGERLLHPRTPAPNEPTPIAPYLIGAPDDDAPISQWSMLDAFDSVAACKAALETGRVQGLNDLQRGVEKYAHDKKVVESQRADIRALYAHAKCIATDDPRLKGKEDP